MSSGARYHAWLVMALAALIVPGCILDRSGTAICTVDSQCTAPARCVDGRCMTSSGDAGVDGGSEDAGFDAGSRPDAGFDAGVADAGTDAGSDAGGDFDPRAIAGLALWLRADSQPLGALDTWNDEGPGMHVATAFEDAPVVAEESGLQVVQFDGGGHFITDDIGWGDASTIFLVARVSDASGTTVEILHSANASDHFALERQMRTRLEVTVAGTSVESTHVADEAFHLYEVVADTEVELRVDGPVTATVPMAIPFRERALGIGGNPVNARRTARLFGAVAELLIWDEVLSASDRAAVAAYLRARWSPLL